MLALKKIEPGKGLELNLGTGRGYSVREVIDCCREVTGHEIVEKIGKRRPGDPPELVANASKALEVLGWEPKYPEIKPIIETAWSWHKNHPNGYQKNEVSSSLQR